jgi:metallo-beta-lactamase family protein
MSFGGRVQRHEKHFLGDKDTTLLLVGYQTPGSPGRRVLEGAKKVRIDGEWVRVRAHIESITGYSGHKDRDQLIEFVENTASTLEKVFVTMGEPKSALFLTQRLRDFLGVDAVAPAAGQTFDIIF